MKFVVFEKRYLEFRLKIQAYHKIYLWLFILKFFADCFKMPSLPQGAFAVHKVKERHQHIAVCKKICGDEKTRQESNRCKLRIVMYTKFFIPLNNFFWTDLKKFNSLNKKTYFQITVLMQLSPSKYNEKMMNSIWGRYNRNSPHNFKKNNAASIGEVEAQQL